MNEVLTVIGLIVFFAIGNRWCGGGFGWNELAAKRVLRGRPLYYFGLLAMCAGWIFFGLAGTLLALLFVVWRLPGWFGAIDAGTDAGSRTRDFLVMAARATPYPVGFAALAYYGLAPIGWLLAIAYGTLLMALIAASYDIAWHFLKTKDPVREAELLAGAFIGLTLAFVLGALP